jgi:sec-independent protein translocase protein TatB
MSFQDGAVLVLLALLLFGPKKLPVLARQLGKLMGDFRRASNEFRTQMEEELRISEQAERQKQVAAIEASAPPNSIAAPIPEPEHPHLPPAVADADAEPASSYDHEPLLTTPAEAATAEAAAAPAHEATPIPIASSGELSILPPATGLPIASSASNGACATSVPNPAHEQDRNASAEVETEILHG